MTPLLPSWVKWRGHPFPYSLPWRARRCSESHTAARAERGRKPIQAHRWITDFRCLPSRVPQILFARLHTDFRVLGHGLSMPPQRVGSGHGLSMPRRLECVVRSVHSIRLLVHGLLMPPQRVGSGPRLSMPRRLECVARSVHSCLLGHGLDCTSSLAIVFIGLSVLIYRSLPHARVLRATRFSEI